MEYRQILYTESKLKCIPFLEVSKLHIIQCASFVAGSHVYYSILKPDGIYLLVSLHNWTFSLFRADILYLSLYDDSLAQCWAFHTS